jgi:hypothetical protein
MTKREKELEDHEFWELYEIIHYNLHDTIGEKVRKIQQAGYTKTPFDVEELKRWLRERKDELQNPEGKFYSDVVAAELNMALAITEVLDKIKELEDGYFLLQ